MARRELDAGDRALLEEVRVARLATATRAAEPHAIPVCFALLDERTLVFAIDEKPKAGGPLRRMRNLAENDRFALVADRWDEDWSRLAYVLVEGRGRVMEDAGRRGRAVELLRRRYPQYVEMDLDAASHPVVELRVEAVRRWEA